ncbi:MAG: hypothetical protein IJZ29_05360 [Clostridia bacterium]|nr:hypothetical protein [Clostridia bacterium]
MKYFKKLENLNSYYNFLYENQANCVDYLGKRYCRKVDRVIRKDYKRSLRLYKIQDKILYKKTKKSIKQSLFKRLFVKIKQLFSNIKRLISNFFNIFKKKKTKKK